MAPYSYMDGDPSIGVRVATTKDQLKKDLCMSFRHNKRFICAILLVNPMIEMSKTNLKCGLYLLSFPSPPSLFLPNTLTTQKTILYS